MAIHRIGLVSDTHGSVHAGIHAAFAGVGMILHAGDVCGDEVLAELESIAPVFAVRGNCDGPSPALPLKRVVETPFGKVGLAHGHEYPSNQESRVRSLIQTFAPNGVRMVMHGHSHEQYLAFDASGVWAINPGAATKPRFRQQSSVCIANWNSASDTLGFNFVALEW